MKPLWLVLVPVTKFGPSFSFLLKLFSIVVKQKIIYHLNHLGFLDGSVVKNLPATAGDTGDLGLIGTNLTKEMKELNKENYKTVIKKKKEKK